MTNDPELALACTDPPRGCPAGDLRDHEQAHGWRRRGLLTIPHGDLHAVLGLPGFVTPLFVQDNPIRGRVEVLAESDIFPRTFDGTEPPAIPLAALYDDDGELIRHDIDRGFTAEGRTRGGYAVDRWARHVEQLQERVEAYVELVELAAHLHGDDELLDTLSRRESDGDDEAELYKAWVTSLANCAERRGVHVDDHAAEDRPLAQTVTEERLRIALELAATGADTEDVLRRLVAGAAL